MGKKSGKEVVFRTLDGLSKHFNIDIIAPGEQLTIKEGRFFSLSSTWFNKLKSIKYLGHLFNYFYVFFLLIQVRKLVNRNKLNPDVVYLAGPWMSFIGHRLFEKKSIIINRYYGVAWNPKSHHSLKNRLRFVIKNLGYKRFGDLVIMTNDGTQGDAFLRRNHCPERSLRFWRNGVVFPVEPKDKIELKALFYKKYGIETNKKLLLSVSRLAAWKRVDISIKAFAKVLETDKNTVLFIVGDGEERPKLELLVKELNIQDFVIFAGSIPGENLSEIYFSADIFLSFYNYSNAGNPLFEAMMHGCCIVTLNSDVMSSFLPDDAGVLLSANQPEIIAQEIRSLLVNSDRRYQFGKRAQVVSKRDFPTWERRIQQEIDEIVRLTTP